MEGRKFIKMSSILKSVNKNQLSGDWVTVGVIVNKIPPKTASNVSKTCKNNLYPSLWIAPSELTGDLPNNFNKNSIKSLHC